ncbi:MAG: plasmid stabilization protein [Hyphomicrobiales bacterium]|nr:plasmid stabilization protein [Hyphomicrobiales bacterium]
MFEILSEATYRAFEELAARHGRSLEAEIRATLDAAVQREGALKMGSAIVEVFRPFGGVDTEIERDRTPAKPADFE